MKENFVILPRFTPTVKTETNDFLNSSLLVIKETKDEVKHEETDKDNVTIEQFYDKPNLRSSLENPNNGQLHVINDDNSNIVADVEHILNGAVISVSKCQQMLASADSISYKAFDSIIERLKSIKDDLSTIQVDLVKIHPLKYEDEIIHIEDLVKAEIVDFPNNPDDLNDSFCIADNELQGQDNTNIKVENDIKERFNEIQNGGDKWLRGVKHKKFCRFCEECFETEKELQAHGRICAFADSSDSSDCDICGKSFSKASQLKRHMSVKHPLEFSPTKYKSGPPYKCNVCNIDFDKKKELNEHIKALNHESDMDKFICEFCNKTLGSKRKYNGHILKFHSKGHACKLCDQAFDDKKELNTHLKTNHDTTNHRCTTCFKEFKTQASLKVHMGEHGIFSCTLCNKNLLTEKSLITHKENWHSRRFKCQECDKAYDSKVLLKNHIATVHAPPKKKVCQTCGHTTHNVQAFWAHIQIHGQKIHKCEVCGKAFSLKRSLILHYRIHTGEKSFVCQTCGAKFRKGSGLTRHRFVHSGEKPHVCFLCNKGFNQSNNLKTHMKSHISGTIPV